MHSHIVRLLDHQLNEHEATATQQLSRIPHKLNKPIFGLLVGKITTHALYKLENELARSCQSDFPSACDGLFTWSMGLPCGHVLRHRANNGRPLELRDIHRHWWFKPLEAPFLAYETIVMEPQLHNPLPVRTRGRPRGGSLSTQNQVASSSSRGRGKGITSTRREPLEFEVTARVTRSATRRRGRQEAL